MYKDLKKLKREFLKIKEEGLVKSLRNGSTGIGYTFEHLINKEEDCLCKPDFGNVEIKCRLAYSKCPITLFTCIPIRDESEFSAVCYIYDNYSYHRYNDENDYRIFARKIFANYTMEINDYSFSLYVDYINEKLIVKAYKNGIFQEDVCYWNFFTLKEKLYTKLRLLAIVSGYPYKRNNEIYYMYTRMDSYKLKGFYEFLKMIEEKKIYIEIYLKENHNTGNKCNFENHGVAFKIKKDQIEGLFYKIPL